jgi:hypothetical protein
VGLVAPGIGVAGLVVANHRVEPVCQVDCPVRSHADVDGPERGIAGLEQLGQLRRFVAGAGILKAMQFHDRSKVSADEGATLDIVGQCAAPNDLECGGLW